MIKTLPPIGLLIAMAALPAAAQQGAHDGSYEYAATGWRGSLKVTTSPNGTTYFAIATRRDDMRCSLLGSGRLSENTITLGAPRDSGSLLLRFFEENAEIEATGDISSFCDAGARLDGVYIHTAETVTLDREDVRAAQSRLNKLGYDAGSVDGILGQRTRTALAAFQRAAGLAESGELGLETLYRLDQEAGRATAAAAGPPAGTGEIAPAETPPATERIVWTTQIPRDRIPVLDGIYGPVVPARIDWSNAPFEIAMVDLDEQSGGGGESDEILVFWNDARFCGDEGCTFEVLRSRDGTYSPVLQTVAREVMLGDAYDEGVRRIVTDGEPWVWDGDAYIQDVYRPTRVR